MDDLKRLAFIELRTARTAASWRDEHLEILDALERRDPALAALERRDPALAARVARDRFLRDDGLLPLRARAEPA